MHPFDYVRSEITKPEEALHQTGGVLGEIDPIGCSNLLHPCCQPDRVPLGRIVHAQVVADLANHDLARVQAHTNGEVEALIHA